jgi:hypothetical protein
MKLYLHSLHSVQSRLRQESVITVERQRMSNKVNRVDIQTIFAASQFPSSIVEPKRTTDRIINRAIRQTLCN